jgi:hypothetical protein
LEPFGSERRNRRWSILIKDRPAHLPNGRRVRGICEAENPLCPIDALYYRGLFMIFKSNCLWPLKEENLATKKN